MNFGEFMFLIFYISLSNGYGKWEWFFNIQFGFAICIIKFGLNKFLFFKFASRIWLPLIVYFKWDM